MAAEVPSRELRNNTRALLRRVSDGEDVVVTVDGRPVATLRAVGAKRRWMPRAEFVARFAANQADPGLRRDLDELAGETTDEAPIR